MGGVFCIERSDSYASRMERMGLGAIDWGVYLTSLKAGGGVASESANFGGEAEEDWSRVNSTGIVLGGRERGRRKAMSSQS